MAHGLGLVRTDRGRRIALSRAVAAPESTVWNLLTDVTRWSEWGPPVTDVDYPDRTISTGTDGRVQVFGLLWIPFRIEVVGEFEWVWTVRGTTPPADGHRVEATGGDESRVVLELPLWAPWYLPLCWLALRNVAVLAESASG